MIGEGNEVVVMNQIPIATLTHSHINQLLSLLNSGCGVSIDSLETLLSGMCIFSSSSVNTIGTNIHSEWIINTGATDHITSSFDILINLISIHSIIHVPNGKTSIITHKGTVRLTDHILLHNVLHVPEFIAI